MSGMDHDTWKSAVLKNAFVVCAEFCDLCYLAVFCHVTLHGDNNKLILAASEFALLGLPLVFRFVTVISCFAVTSSRLFLFWKVYNTTRCLAWPSRTPLIPRDTFFKQSFFPEPSNCSAIRQLRIRLPCNCLLSFDKQTLLTVFNKISNCALELLQANGFWYELLSRVLFMRTVFFTDLGWLCHTDTNQTRVLRLCCNANNLLFLHIYCYFYAFVAFKHFRDSFDER